MLVTFSLSSNLFNLGHLINLGPLRSTHCIINHAEIELQKVVILLIDSSNTSRGYKHRAVFIASDKNAEFGLVAKNDLMEFPHM